MWQVIMIFDQYNMNAISMDWKLEIHIVGENKRKDWALMEKGVGSLKSRRGFR